MPRAKQPIFASHQVHPASNNKFCQTGDNMEMTSSSTIALTWVPDEGVRKRILVDNPARLYGFEESKT